MNRIIERRNLPVENLETCAIPSMDKIEVKARADGAATLEGVAAVFDKESRTIGGMRGLPMIVEEFAAGCFDGSLGNDNIISLAHHDISKVIASEKSGTLTLTKTADELRAVICPQTQEGQLIIEQVGAGLLNGMSVGYICLNDRWLVDGNLERRIILEAELIEVSPVTLPQYPDTRIALRSRALALGDKPQETGSFAEIAAIKAHLENIDLQLETLIAKTNRPPRIA